MNHLTQLINNYGPFLQLVIFVIVFFISWNIENIAGVIFNYKKWKHAFVNIPFGLTNMPGQLLLGIAFVKTIEWTTQHHFGFLYLLPKSVNPFLVFVVSFIFLDFGEYIYHIIMHKVKRLWMFHIVHHSDSVVDVSTTFREHPGENIIRLLFTLIWVFVSGTVFWMLLLRQIIQVASTLFAHINYRLPEKTDRIVGVLFITPNLHHVHHHYQQPYTDCNYGDVLSIWDRLFGTFKRMPLSQVVYGVDSVMDKRENNNFFNLTKLPFGRYRKINRMKDTVTVKKEPTFLKSTASLIIK
jgi:sterol desaturase/sphingolipid hydroxylase (fatty acid hydroxylase superfamily)